ncbi:unnamed protein product, partial [Oppiella nova]
EMQTQDFMKCLVQKYSNCGQQSDNALINGFNNLGVSDRPASIFQCRMKLLSEWFAHWSDEEKAELLIRLRNIDSTFMDEFQANLDHYQTTGAHTGAATDEHHMNHINGNIDDDSKTATEHLVSAVIVNGDHNLNDETPVVEENTGPTDDKAVLDDNDNDYPSSNAQQIIVNGNEEVEEYTKQAIDESVVIVNESSPAEVCG